jgi:hypothetical protein
MGLCWCRYQLPLPITPMEQDMHGCIVPSDQVRKCLGGSDINILPDNRVLIQRMLLIFGLFGPRWNMNQIYNIRSADHEIIYWCDWLFGLISWFSYICWACANIIWHWCSHCAEPSSLNYKRKPHALAKTKWWRRLACVRCFVCADVLPLHFLILTGNRYINFFCIYSVVSHFLLGTVRI